MSRYRANSRTVVKKKTTTFFTTCGSVFFGTVHHDELSDSND